MSAARSLPARPSLESLRKQAKKLARDIAAGDAAAIARARAQLPKVNTALTQRNAQLVIAREYGFAGWQDLTAEVMKRLDRGLEWAVARARRAIHDNDVEALKKLLTEYPALLSWQGDDPQSESGLLGLATGAYGDAGDAQREGWFTRGSCAELLIDAGAVVMPPVVNGLLDSRARGLLDLFHRKGLLPPTLNFHAALGDLNAVRPALEAHDLAAVHEAFAHACRFGHEAVASLLLERAIALDPELGSRIDERVGRAAFVQDFIDNGSRSAITIGPWQAFVKGQIDRAVRDGDREAFVRGLERDPWLLAESAVDFQNEFIESAALNGNGGIITALLDREPSLLRRQPPPDSQAIEFAITYKHTDLVPLLTRIWPLPDDLAHAAGVGDLARVQRWFDASGAPSLGDLARHYPCNNPHLMKHDDLRWGPPAVQHVLDVALAWSVINGHFDVADFLIAGGANVSTNWNSHEPASILHHLVFLPDPYDSMRFLIDRGIDLTMKDYRWDATAAGWARYALQDEQMARWLEAQSSMKDD